ncbi:hypothetical protein UFOVP736_23 [uncultured Caudovirales phage]|uniref:Uncharacterized protein n=1 Tax=uncultured Caudovirales phage TaxID=2100421 RepID=A0A6J7X1A3_9CAUD|nr:hypothetical protein UFOVP705_58 [uncultured Caudovirales phage]CAB5223969.1 hypothetical protein UFOVP736_23 [uncultured Caudovirales phage]
MRNILAEAWAEDLEERSSVRVYPQRRGAEADVPFAVVRVPELEQVIGGSDVWYGEVQVVVVRDIALAGGSAVTAHHQAVREIYTALEQTPKNGVDPVRQVRLFGYQLTRHEEVQVSGPRGEKVYADVFFLTVGAGLAKLT